MADFSNVTIPGLARVQVVGLDELEKKLKDIGPKQARKAFRNAGRKAAEIWVGDMQERVPKNTGFLETHIGSAVRIESKEDLFTIHVGPAKEAFWGIFHEFGTKKMAAHPFMRPTFMEHQDDILQLFADLLWNELKALEQ